MHVLPDRTDQAVRSAIEAWVGLLVEQRFEEAMAMLGQILDLPEGAVLTLDDVHVV
jgi:hypothetical protein